MNKNTLIFNLFFIFLALTSSFTAQIGVNNPTPDPSAVLDLSGGANTGKGLLLPTTTNVIGVTAPARGLIVLDSVTNEVYIYNQDSARWYSTSSWVREFGVNTIQTNFPTTINNDLTISGKTTVEDVQVNDNISGQNNTSYIENINGAVPPGTMVLWTGTIANIPYGWGLCNGSYYRYDGSVCCTNCTPIQELQCRNTPGTLFAPNMGGRFPVGYEPGNTDYDEIVTDIGGETRHRLTMAELPNHTHNYSGSTSTDGNHAHNSSGSERYDHNNVGASSLGLSWQGTQYNGVEPAGDHSHTFSGTTDNGTGGNQLHENRPPYRVVAYIMKLKNHP